MNKPASLLTVLFDMQFEIEKEIEHIKKVLKERTEDLQEVKQSINMQEQNLLEQFNHYKK